MPPAISTVILAAFAAITFHPAALAPFQAALRHSRNSGNYCTALVPAARAFVPAIALVTRRTSPVTVARGMRRAHAQTTDQDAHSDPLTPHRIARRAPLPTARKSTHISSREVLLMTKIKKELVLATTTTTTVLALLTLLVKVYS